MTTFFRSVMALICAAASAFAFYEIGRAFSNAPQLRKGRDIALLLASFLLIASLVILP